MENQLHFSCDRISAEKARNEPAALGHTGVTKSFTRKDLLVPDGHLPRPRPYRRNKIIEPTPIDEEVSRRHLRQYESCDDIFDFNILSSEIQLHQVICCDSTDSNAQKEDSDVPETPSLLHQYSEKELRRRYRKHDKFRTGLSIQQELNRHVNPISFDKQTDHKTICSGD